MAASIGLIHHTIVAGAVDGRHPGYAVAILIAGTLLRYPWFYWAGTPVRCGMWKVAMGRVFAIDDGKAILQGDLMLVQGAVDVSAGAGAGGFPSEFSVLRSVRAVKRNGLGFDAGVGRGVLGELVARGGWSRCRSRSRVLRKPGIDGAIHQAVAEEKHEDDGDERD